MGQGYIVVNFKWVKSHVAAIEMKPFLAELLQQQKQLYPNF